MTNKQRYSKLLGNIANIEGMLEYVKCETERGYLLTMVDTLYDIGDAMIDKDDYSNKSINKLSGLIEGTEKYLFGELTTEQRDQYERLNEVVDLLQQSFS